MASVRRSNFSIWGKKRSWENILNIISLNPAPNASVQPLPELVEGTGKD